MLFKSSHHARRNLLVDTDQPDTHRTVLSRQAHAHKPSSVQRRLVLGPDIGERM